MIDKFEREYLDYYWKNKTFQWKNYFEDGNYNLSSIDADIYKIATKYNNLIQPAGGKSKIACSLIQKDLVDKNPVVSNLRNRIDNLENYTENIAPDLDRNNYLIEISSRMKKDVLGLMNNRNNLAKQLGYPSYPDLILSTEEIDKYKLVNLLNEYVNFNLPTVKELICKYKIKWESWFSDLNNITSPVENLNYTDIINQFVDKMGLNIDYNKMQIIFNSQEIAGEASQLLPDDIRIVASPIRSLADLTTLFHELGHAISYFYNKEEGLYKIPSPCYDEAMAVVIEHIAPKVLFNDIIQERAAELQLLEYTRCAVSSLFEFELWEEPENADNLYIKHYGRLGFNINNPVIWAYDSFRSIDPVYIHNYVIGAVLAKKLITYFEKTYYSDYREWGSWLVKNIYDSPRKDILDILGTNPRIHKINGE